MDLIKIGKFISLKRKEKGMTQEELAEKLFVSDRAISKWENGVCLPDVANMQLLCELLEITINDLFSGEVVDMNDNEKKLEENLLEMTKMKEASDRRLLNLEIVIGIIITVLFLTIVTVTSYVDMKLWIKVVLNVIGFVSFLVAVGFLLLIEQKAGYYECKICHYKYVPTYKKVLLAMHNGRTRRMKCPKCGKKSWQKKVLSK